MASVIVGMGVCGWGEERAASDGSPANWQQLSAAQLSVWVEQATTRPASVRMQAARAEVARHAWSRYLSDAAFLRGEARGDAFRLARAVGADLEAGQRQQLLEQLMRGYAEDVQALKGLPLEQFMCLRDAFYALQAARGQRLSLVGNWMSVSEQWRHCTPRQVRALLVPLQPGAAPPYVAAKAKLAGYAWEKYLGDENYWAKADAAEVLLVLSATAPSLTPAQKQAAARRVRDRFVLKDEFLTQAEFAQVLLLRAATLAVGGSRSEVAEMAGRWVRKATGPQWKKCSVEELCQLAVLLRGSTAQGTVVDHLWEHYFADRQYASQVPREQLLQSVLTVTAALDAEQKPAYKRRVMQRYVEDRGMLGSLSVPEVLSLRGVMNQVGASDAEMAGILVAWASASGPQASTVVGPYWRFNKAEYWPYFSLVWNLRKEKGQVLSIQSQLSDEQGQVRPTAAKLLAYGYLLQGKMADWQKFLDEKLKDPALEGDKRAGWLLARAYAAEVGQDPAAPLEGRKWLDQALAAARSEPARIECLRWLVGRYLATEQFAQAEAMLKSVEGQFGAETAKAFAAWREAVGQAQRALQADKAAYARQAQAAWRAEVERRLEVARQANDRELVARCEQLLKQQ